MKIELADRVSHERFASAPDIAQAIIGNAEDCDVWLPRARYPELGRKELRILAQPRGATITSLQPTHVSTLAGKPLAAEATVPFGTHDLIINGRRFELIIAP